MTSEKAQKDFNDIITKNGFTEAARTTDTNNIVYHSVVFLDHDGSVLLESRIAEGSAATPPADPVRTGHTFTGWSGAYDCITADCVLNATYLADTLTLTLYDADTVIGSIETSYGTAFAVPKTPTTSGYSFVDWYTRPEGGEVYGFATAATSSLSLYARYEKIEVKTYTVTFLDGEGSTYSSQKVAEGENAVAPAYPTLVGYTCTGWDSDYTNVAADITVRPVFVKKTYTVTFLEAEGSDVVLKAETVAYGDAANAFFAN